MTARQKWAEWENTGKFDMFTSEGMEEVTFRGPFEGYR